MIRYRKGKCSLAWASVHLNERAKSMHFIPNQIDIISEYALWYLIGTEFQLNLYSMFDFLNVHFLVVHLFASALVILAFLQCATS